MYASPCRRLLSSLASRCRIRTAPRPWLLSVLASSVFYSTCLLGDYRSSDAPVHQQNVLTITTKQVFDEVVVAGGHNVFLVLINDQERDYQLASCLLRRWIHALAHVVAHPVLRFVLFDGARCSVPHPLSDPAPEIYIFPVDKHPSPAVHFSGPLTFPTPLLTFLQDLIPSLRLDIVTLSAHPVLMAAASFSQLVKDYMDVGTRFNDIIRVVEKATTTEEDSRLQRLTKEVEHSVTAFIRANVSDVAVDSLHMRQVEQAVQQSTEKMRKEVASWNSLVMDVKLGRIALSISQQMLEDLTDALAEEELNEIQHLIQQLTSIVEPFGPQDISDRVWPYTEILREVQQRWKERVKVDGVDQDKNPPLTVEEQRETSLSSTDQVNDAEREASMRRRLGPARKALMVAFLPLREKLFAKQTEMMARSDGGKILKCDNAAEVNIIFAEASRSKLLTAIHFTSVWMRLCKQIRDVFSSLSAQSTDIVFACCDMNTCKDLAEQWKVSKPPTIIFIRDAVELAAMRLEEQDVQQLSSRIELLSQGKQQRSGHCIVRYICKSDIECSKCSTAWRRGDGTASHSRAVASQWMTREGDNCLL